MRQITDHRDGHELTKGIRIDADDPGPGGASHVYDIFIEGKDPGEIVDHMQIRFQRGPRNLTGAQAGVVESVLLGIVADRMRSFQAGKFGCRENALVLTKVEEALHWLRHRADGRAARGVLGTYTK